MSRLRGMTAGFELPIWKMALRHSLVGIGENCLLLNRIGPVLFIPRNRP